MATFKLQFNYLPSRWKMPDWRTLGKFPTLELAKKELKKEQDHYLNKVSPKDYRIINEKGGEVELHIVKETTETLTLEQGKELAKRTVKIEEVK